MKGWWVELAKRARPHGRSLGGLVGLSLLGVGLDLLKPWPLKLIVDSVLAEDPLPAAAAWLVGLPGAAGRSGLLAWLAGATVLLFILRRLVTLAHRYTRTGDASSGTATGVLRDSDCRGYCRNGWRSNGNAQRLWW